MLEKKKKVYITNPSIVSQTCSDENLPKQTKEVTKNVASKSRKEDLRAGNLFFSLGELNDVSLQFSSIAYFYITGLMLTITMILAFYCLALCARSDDTEAELIQR